jgi:4'-phosphopantetheinyl transferase EntD
MATEYGRQLVAVLDSTELTADTCGSYLSAVEVGEASAIAHPRRRQEWLAGRMAAKFVFLQRELTGACAQSNGLYLKKISVAELAAFAQEVYRSVAVSRNQSAGGGPARIGWNTSAQTVTVAISHVNGLSCAYIGGTAETYSIDLEANSPRVPEFYLQNFTPREKNWVGNCARSLDLKQDWLYTLLWSAKECLLKTPEFADMSLWDMPSIEVHVLGGSERLRKLHTSDRLGGDFQILDTRIIPSTQQVRLAVSGNANLILTAITRLD